MTIDRPININFLVYGVVPLLWLLILATCFKEPLSLITKYWYVSVISFFAAGFANITAVGGGFIFIPMIIIVLQLTPLTALKLSLSTEAFGMTSGALAWSRKNIIWNVFLACAISSSIGMFLGTFVLRPDSFLIKAIFGVVSIAIGAITLRLIRYHGMGVSIGAVEPIFYIIGLLGGLLTSWISIGIGEVIAFLLMARYKVKTEIAIGTGVALLALNAILGFAFHSLLGGIPWELLIFTAPAVVMGARTFVLLAKKIDTIILKLIFSVIAIIDGMVMLLHVFGYI